MDDNLYKPNTSSVSQPGQSYYSVPPINPGRFARIIQWIKQHKKIVFVAINVLLVTGLWLLFYPNIKNRFFPSPNQSNSQINQQQADLPALMEVKPAKNEFRVNEAVKVSVYASSDNQLISGFDAVFIYDPEFLVPLKKNPPTLNDFEYASTTAPGTFRTIGVRKADSALAPFKESLLFEIEFSAKKPGKTSLDLMFSPNRTNDSNLINGESKDILGDVRGAEIEITQ